MFIKKVVVNLGGKYCFVLFLEGEVYFWGEVEDGKLGYGNRSLCDCFCVIEFLRGIEVVDVVVGGVYSVCVIVVGDFYMWGKGCYGWLGYSDSED